MPQATLNDLQAFVAVAKARSFTRAAAELGVSQSALSHTIRTMETRLGIRLLERTTRSVAPTEAGQRMLGQIGPHLAEIEAELEALTTFRERAAGKIRISASEHALRTVLWPKLDRFAKDYPDIQVEVDIENGLIDIIERGFDAGIRLGEQVAKDMIAVRIAPDWRMAVVASPGYFLGRSRPVTPRDLTDQNCIKLRLVSYGGFYAWEFEKDGERLNVRVEGQLAFNSSIAGITAALAGHGLACVPEEDALPHIRSGRLVQVLADWMPTFAGHHIYYPSRKTSPAFDLFLSAIRYREIEEPHRLL